MNFRVKEKLALRISGRKIFFSTQKVGRKMIFSQYLRNLRVLRNEKGRGSAPQKKNKKSDKREISLVWNIMFTDN